MSSLIPKLSNTDAFVWYTIFLLVVRPNDWLLVAALQSNSLTAFSIVELVIRANQILCVFSVKTESLLVL